MIKTLSFFQAIFLRLGRMTSGSVMPCSMISFLYSHVEISSRTFFYKDLLRVAIIPAASLYLLLGLSAQSFSENPISNTKSTEDKIPLSPTDVEKLIEEYKAAAPFEGGRRYFLGQTGKHLEMLSNSDHPIAYRFLIGELSKKEQFYGQHGEISSLQILKQHLLSNTSLTVVACLEVYPGVDKTHRIRILKMLEEARSKAQKESKKGKKLDKNSHGMETDAAIGMPNWFEPLVPRLVAVLDDVLSNRTSQEAYYGALLARALDQPETLNLLIPLLTRTDKVLARRPIRRWDVIDQFDLPPRHRTQG